MPEVSPVQAASIRESIARASATTGVDFDYLLAQARIESGLDTQARAPGSSAAGLYQFIGSTWLETLDRHGGAHGMGWADAAITRRNGRAVVDDPAMRAQIMALRLDPDASAVMAAELARDNAGALEAFLGRQPGHAELYLAHFLGAGGARDFLGALRDTPGASAAALFPRPAAANRGIFYQSGRARSIAEVMQVMESKVARAKGQAGDDGFTLASSAVPSAGATPQAYSYTARRAAPGLSPDHSVARPSMADTLRSTFGAGDGLSQRAVQRVDAAYRKFRAFSL